MRKPLYAILVLSPGLYAQTAQLTPFFRQQFFTSTGAIAAGYKLCSYQAGTSTPLATYTDQTGATPNANPVILGSDGAGNIWLLNRAYKLTLLTPGSDNTCSTGSVVKTVDNVNPFYRYTGTAAPVSGTYQTGDFVWNTTPSTTPGSASAVLGWLCTAGGSPGTWVPVEPMLNGHIQQPVTFDQAVTFSGGASFNGNQGDPTQVLWVEEFETPGTFNAGTSFDGLHGWFLTSIGNGCSSTTFTGSTFAHPGVMNDVSAPTAAGDACLMQPNGKAQLFGAVGNANNWTLYLIFELGQTANTDIRIGLSDGSILAPNNGIFLRYVSSTDSNFVFENRLGGVATTSTTNSVAVDTNWHCVKISGTSTPGTVGYQIGATCSTLGTQTLVTGAPTAALLGPYLVVASDSVAGARTLTMDLFLFNATGVGR